MDRHYKNCDKMLYAGDDFCSKCGSRWVDYRLTPREISREFSNKYLGADNKFLATMLALITMPEDVINGYITGQRKRYVNPANFYLIGLTLIGIQLFILKNFSPELLGYNTETTDTFAISVFNYLYDYFGLWTTVLMPAYIITGYLVFMNLKKYNFSEHLIFYVYAFGFSNILFALCTPLLLIFDIEFLILFAMTTVFNLVQITYYYKRVFNLNWSRLILKMIIALHLYAVVNLIYSALLALLIFGIVKLFIPDMSFPTVKIS
ncbi:MAG: DUF3667 domain-containing protein [Nonlabens sp.]